MPVGRPQAAHVPDVAAHDLLGARAVAVGERVEDLQVLLGGAEQPVLLDELGQPVQAGLGAQFADQVDQAAVAGELEQRDVEQAVGLDVGDQVVALRRADDVLGERAQLLDLVAVDRLRPGG